MLIVVNCLQLQWRIAGGNYIRRLQLDHNSDNNCVNCGDLPTITREMPRLPVYIPAGDAREDGLIFKQAYAASLFEVGRWARGSSRRAGCFCYYWLATPCLPSPPPLPLPCMYLKMIDGSLSSLYRPSPPACASHAASRRRWSFCISVPAAVLLRLLSHDSRQPVQHQRWSESKVLSSIATTVSCAAEAAAGAATAMFQDLGTRDYTTTSIHT